MSKSVHSAIILVAAFLSVFWEGAFHAPRQFLGAQIDFLPPLMVYAALRAGVETVALLAIFGGLWLDSLSANPLGITVLPLFAVGFTIYRNRELILRDEAFAQFILGLGASAATPVLTLMLLLTKGSNPLLGWGTFWQLLVMSAGGAICTPVVFVIFDWVRKALMHNPEPVTSFRLDREIRRGR
jgi:rod shape-determining protein MreD